LLSWFQHHIPASTYIKRPRGKTSATLRIGVWLDVDVGTFRVRVLNP
jgi:hypothetical protein